MTNKTAMEMLIENLQKEKEVFKDNPDVLNGYNNSILEALSLLPTERTQIEEAYIYGLRNGGSIKALTVHQKQASDYFTKKYKDGE